MKKIITSIAIALSALSAQAISLSSEQVKVLCKIVDPSFLNILPVIVDAKVHGASDNDLRIILAATNRVYNNLSVNTRFLNAIEAIYASNVTTPEQAISYLENECYELHKEKLNLNAIISK